PLPQPAPARRALGRRREAARHRAGRRDRGGRERHERSRAGRAARGASGGQRVPRRGHDRGQRERPHERRRPHDGRGAQGVSGILATATEPIAHESWIVQIVKALLIFAFVLGIVPIILWGERKLLGRFQARLGPNRVGPFGLMQPMADVLKLLSKEQFTPSTAVPWMMALAPVISILTAVAALAIIPFG